MLRLALSCLIVSCSGFAARAAEEAVLPHPELIESAKIPSGFETLERKLEDEGNVSYLVVVQKAGQVSKVVITIETRKLSDVDYRRAATKGYINGNAKTILGLGYKVIEKKIPDVAAETFEKPVSVSAVFQNDEGTKFWLHQEIFFTDKGFAVTVFADDEAQFETLKTWAKTVRATPAGK